MPTKPTPMRVTLLKAKHGDIDLDTPMPGLLQVIETNAEGTITKAEFRRSFKGEYRDPVTVTDCEFIYLTPDHQTTRAPLDTDTSFRGLDGPFDYWESDHTGLVHVLWSASHQGLTLQGDPDEVASMICRSRWLRAVKAHAAEAEHAEGAKTE